MSRICVLLLVAVALAVCSCESTDKGSREYVPGKGWVPVQN